MPLNESFWPAKNAQNLGAFCRFKNQFIFELILAQKSAADGLRSKSWDESGDSKRYVFEPKMG